MKTCTQCRVDKSITEFRVRSKTKGTYSPWCKPCFSAYEKEKWKNSPDRRKSNKDANKIRKIRNAQFIYDYLLQHPCPCGERDPVVLDFDHRDGEDKTANVADMLRSSYGIATIEAEISKCNVLCSNCHRRRTAVQQGWYANLIRV